MMIASDAHDPLVAEAEGAGLLDRTLRKPWTWEELHGVVLLAQARAA